MNAGLITVVSVRGVRYRLAPTNLIYIGRNGRHGWPRSPLANPFKLATEADRAAVIERYKVWLWDKIKSLDDTVTAEIDHIAHRVKRGETVQLGCWCSPLPCHGDVVKAAVLWGCENRT